MHVLETIGWLLQALVGCLIALMVPLLTSWGLAGLAIFVDERANKLMQRRFGRSKSVKFSESISFVLISPLWWAIIVGVWVTMPGFLRAEDPFAPFGHSEMWLSLVGIPAVCVVALLLVAGRGYGASFYTRLLRHISLKRPSVLENPPTEQLTVRRVTVDRDSLGMFHVLWEAGLEGIFYRRLDPASDNSGLSGHVPAGSEPFILLGEQDRILVFPAGNSTPPLYSSNGGVEWTQVPPPPFEVDDQIAYTKAGNDLYIFLTEESGRVSLYGSRDFGISWFESKLPPELNAPQVRNEALMIGETQGRIVIYTQSVATETWEVREREQRLRHGRILTAYSSDRAQSWSEPRDITHELTGDDRPAAVRQALTVQDPDGFGALFVIQFGLRMSDGSAVQQAGVVFVDDHAFDRAPRRLRAIGISRLDHKQLLNNLISTTDGSHWIRSGVQSVAVTETASIVQSLPALLTWPEDGPNECMIWHGVPARISRDDMRSSTSVFYDREEPASFDKETAPSKALFAVDSIGSMLTYSPIVLVPVKLSFDIGTWSLIGYLFLGGWLIGQAVAFGLRQEYSRQAAET